MAKVTLTIASGTGGTVTPTTGLYDIGVAINITAIPSVGYDFVSWSDGSTVTTNAIRSVTPSVDATYTASFTLHVWTATDTQNMTAFVNTYSTYAGVIGNQPNAAMANKMLPNVVLLLAYKSLFDQLASFGQNTATVYENIVNILNSFNPEIIPIV